jgi:hypothetical protein
MKRLGLARDPATVAPLLPPVEDQAADVVQAPTAALAPATVIESFDSSAEASRRKVMKLTTNRLFTDLVLPRLSRNPVAQRDEIP